MKNLITLMDKGRIKRTIKRLSLQVWENMEGNSDVYLIGLNERGYAVAEEMVGELSKLMGRKINLVRYNVAEDFYDGNLAELVGQQVVVVDDVIFSGRTMFKALTSIFDHGLPEMTQVAVLVDRGHRKFPVKANFTGINIPTKPGEHVDVVSSNHELYAVELTKKN